MTVHSFEIWKSACSNYVFFHKFTRAIFYRKLRQTKSHVDFCLFSPSCCYAYDNFFYCNKEHKLLVAFIRIDCVGIWLSASIWIAKVSFCPLHTSSRRLHANALFFASNYFNNFLAKCKYQCTAKCWNKMRLWIVFKWKILILNLEYSIHFIINMAIFIDIFICLPQFLCNARHLRAAHG